MSSEERAIQVFVRIKPRRDLESSMKSTGTNIYITNPRNDAEKIGFKFTKVFNELSTQDDIFDHVEPIITQVLSGRNATIFTYGQTGSGKTYTMNATGHKSEIGITLKVLQLLILQQQDVKQDASKGRKLSINASFLEIYNEKIFDLLTESIIPLELRENSEKEIIVNKLTNVTIDGIETFKKHLDQALKCRSTASTKLNSESSRSHLIVQLSITIPRHGMSNLVSKLHLVDLAGSEDNKRTGNIGTRMSESCAINKSLFTLSKVVDALNKKSTRIPYRDSKITRLLQDSIGGRSIGLIIACCSPETADYQDTYNTLTFAAKASLIKNEVVVNEEVVLIKSDEIKSRKDSLLDWKSRHKSVDVLKLKTCSRSARNSGESVKRLSGGTSEKEETVSPSQKNISITDSKLSKKEFDEHVGIKVNEKLKELSKSWTSSAHFQKAISDRCFLIEQRVFQKLSSNKDIGSQDEKENIISDALNIPFTKNNVKDLDSLMRSTKIDILEKLNLGDLKIIMTLKMVGKKRAQAIIDCRHLNGLFNDLSDLTKAGLKESQISSIFKANIDI